MKASKDRFVVAAFIKNKARIDELLAEMAAHSDDHFDVMPDAISWGDVGLLHDLAEKLQNVADIMAKRGEYAA